MKNSKYRCRCIHALLVLILLGGLACGVRAQVFGQKISLPLGFAAWDTSIGDLAGDSRLDVVVLGNGTLTILENKGLCASPVYHTIVLTSGATKIYLRDMNLDGATDIVLSGHSTITVLHRNATGFSTLQLAIPNAGASGIYFEDLDGDGFEDIVRGFFWCRQISLGIYAAATSLPLSPGILADAIRAGSGDFDGDGHADLLTTRAGMSGSSFTPTIADIHLNDGNGNFVLSSSINVGDGTANTVFLLDDLDIDGRTDFIGTAFAALCPGIIAFRGTPSGGLTPFGQTSDIGMGIGSFRTADIDGDGNRDLMWSHVSGTFGLSNGTPQFSLAGATNLFSATLPIPSDGEYGIGMSAGDISGDGIADIAFIQFDRFSGAPRPFVQIVFGGSQDAVMDSEFVVVSGQDQVVQQFESMTEDIVVELRSCEGNPNPFSPVSISTNGGASSATQMLTDAVGRLTIPVTAGQQIGNHSILLSHAIAFGGTTNISFFVRGLTVNASTTPTTTGLILRYAHEHPGVPITITADAPLPGSGFLASLFGPIYSTIANPGPSLFALDGLGLLGPPDPALVANPSYLSVITLPLSLTGQTFVFQAIAYDTNYPYPDSVILSIPQTVNF